MDNVLPHVTELLQVVSLVARTFPGSHADIVRAPINGAPMDLIRLPLPPRANLYFIPTPHFPELPPAIIVQWDNGDDRDYLTLRWSFGGDPVGKIAEALQAFIYPSINYATAYGITPSRPLTRDPDIAARAGWRRLLTGEPLAPSASSVARSRVDPGLIDAFAGCNVLIVGLGSVGSYMAEQFVRTGIGYLGLIDHDIVEDSNLSRTIYDRGDVGLSKAKALERRLLNIAPDVMLEVCETEFQRTSSDRLRQLFASADLIVAATDDPIAQAQINSCAQYSDKPTLHVGLYRGAKGGEIVIAVPGLTPCFRCQVGATRTPAPNGASVEREVDYGTGRLAGEVALGCDIQHVSSAALKLALSLLAALKSADSSLASFTIGAVQRGLNMLTLGMEPEWWFYPEVFRQTSGQYAYQSVWISSEHRADCPDCGVSRESGDPFIDLSGDIDVGELRRLINNPGSTP